MVRSSEAYPSLPLCQTMRAISAEPAGYMQRFLRKSTWPARRRSRVGICFYCCALISHVSSVIMDVESAPCKRRRFTRKPSRSLVNYLVMYMECCQSISSGMCAVHDALSPAWYVLTSGLEMISKTDVSPKMHEPSSEHPKTLFSPAIQQALLAAVQQFEAVCSLLKASQEGATRTEVETSNSLPRGLPVFPRCIVHVS